MKGYDFAIIGGGMVGAAAAVGLAKQGFEVAVIEGAMPEAPQSIDPIDLRVSAIAQGSVTLLKKLGAWQDIAAFRAVPYRRLLTWESTDCSVEFSATDLDVDVLGYIVENRVVQHALLEQFENLANITLFDGASLSHFVQGDEGVELSFSDGSSIRCDTLIGADGANSKVRELANIGITAWDYRQRCMLIHVETEHPQQDITWQWFTPSGPRSYLPLVGNQASLVWYDSPSKIKALQMQTNEQLAQSVQDAFPNDLGKVRVLNHGSFPLTRRHAKEYVSGRVVLLGDAAHTINPLAGQGVNLGFRDVSALLKCIQDEGNTAFALKRYQRQRRPDNLLMQSTMDLFYKGFSNELPPLKFARNAAFKLASKSGPLKQWALKYALGL